MVILSNNQWNCNFNYPWWIEHGEDSSSDKRMPELVRAYLEAGADIIGLQECNPHMNELVMDYLRPEGFAMITGGFTPLLYRADKFEVKESGYYSFDSAIPGHEGSFNDVGSKSFCWGVFTVKETGKNVAVLSVHLWWMSGDPASTYYQPFSDEARAMQILLTCRKMDEITEKYACPGVIMGDLNAKLNSLCLKAAFEEGWRSAYDVAREERTENSGYHYCFPDGYDHQLTGDYAQALDHILVKRGGEVKKFLRFEPEWFDKLSDHYPVYITFEV